MYFETFDLNGATEYFTRRGRRAWSELREILDGLTPQIQPSDQAGKVGAPIFDPKATNAALTEAAASLGWNRVYVPHNLQAFGSDWDAGKGTLLAEWQFSNYPFLWNNVIRTEAVFQAGSVLRPLTGAVDALVIVTKSGSFPASNSTLYFEQARAQLDTVTTLGVFRVPIRLVGLSLPPGINRFEADLNLYSARYGRRPASTQRRSYPVRVGRPGQYANRPFIFD